MLAEIGHFSLILGFSFALLAALMPVVAVKMKAPYLTRYVWPLSYGAFGSILTSIVLLAVGFATDDFSVAYIAHHSNTQLPIFFKVAAVWGGHEGSFLFWVFSLSGWAALVAACYHNKPEQHVYISRVLAILAALVATLTLFTLLTSNPFERLFPVPLEGRDLNPMLQDVGLIFHPPMLYLGYVGFAVSFAFAVAALTFEKPQWQWAQLSRSWTLSAWVFLTGGIALGSWWAYYELGWGGWWFWDPVENASLLPWLTGTALLHSLIVTAQRRSLVGWSLLLAIFTFSLSLLGTFIVRSGVLTSVHAFAVDPTRGLVLLAILAVMLISALTLYALRCERYLQAMNFELLSREAAFLVGNSLLAVATLTVLLGTFYPMIFQAFGLGSISVGAPYFNSMFVPLSMVTFFVMGLGVLVRLRASAEDFLITRLLAPLSASIIGGVVLSVLFERGVNLVVCGALICALWIILTALQSLILLPSYQKSQHNKRIEAESNTECKLGHDPMYTQNRPRLRQLAMLIAHVGVAVTVIGATLVSNYSHEISRKMGPGDTAILNDFQFDYLETELLIGPNYTAEQANIQLTKLDHFAKNKAMGFIQPQRRHYTVRTMNMSEPGIRWWWNGDVYITLGEKLNATDYAVRIQYKPFVRWLWVGAILMMLGGALSVIARLTMRRKWVAESINASCQTKISAVDVAQLPENQIIWKQNK
ncbi:heme lyase CcmF/NrfE family subunit [Photobacterium sanguinicancri]|uniref:heme lyase CcmF/NrfE family subunit n=1 Tax=Photobacterium sanguinicancri TaxID=875932 RepID=UPI003D11D013